ncbi:MAG: pilus assembly protein [Burkholderiaceae bacterium]|nr:pilus assembly protein [Burkholderiaceae bacterium]
MVRSYYAPSSGRPRRRQRGVAAVEFALVAIVFFTVLFSIIDWSYLFFANLSMQHAVREGARYAVTGQSGLSPTPGDRCAAAREMIRTSSTGMYDKTGAKTTFKTINAGGQIVTLGASSCYGAEQLIIIQVDSALRPVTPFLRPFFAATGGEYRFSVATTMKNEAWE